MWQPAQVGLFLTGRQTLLGLAGACLTEQPGQWQAGWPPPGDVLASLQRTGGALAFDTGMAACRSECLLSILMQGYPAFGGLTDLPNLHGQLVPMAAMPPAHCLEAICHKVSIECRRRQGHSSSQPRAAWCHWQQLSPAAGCNTLISSKALASPF